MTNLTIQDENIGDAERKLLKILLGSIWFYHSVFVLNSVDLEVSRT